MIKDLECVYAEIKHHLNDVLADETITTIIQMLKDYPQLKENLRKAQHDATHSVASATFSNALIIDELNRYKVVIDEIKEFAEDGKGFDGRFVKKGNDEVWKHYNEDLKEILFKLESQTTKEDEGKP